MARASKSVQKESRTKSRLTPLVPATHNQKIALQLLQDYQAVVMHGTAGTGKTYIAVHHALSKLFSREVSKVIFTRPLTTVGNEKMGFLPGDVNEKTKPFTEQFTEYLSEFAPMMMFQDVKKIEEAFEFIPLGFLRGRNLRNAVVIADEMQNSSLIQMKTLLTRIAEDTQIIILGDTRQADVPMMGKDGLSDLLHRIQDKPNGFIEHVRFGISDIQRSEFVKHVMSIYGDLD